MNQDNYQKKFFWEQISTLYDQVVALPENERIAFLDQNCPDSALRHEVEALLKVRETSARYFDSLAANLNNFALVYDELSDLVPEAGRVGNYSIVEKIGRGGMGTVYLAERADETYESLVAIKILRRGLDSDDILARFHIERQILARLSHPNITHLLDGGLTDDNRPYFVMEYVKGLPITEWCDKNKLSLDRRLRLFFQVCEALEYAHKNLVIHRDLKPGNILVTEEEQVKLLDFGIAKLLDDEAAAPVTLLKTGFRLMTPEYASPEQVRGQPINTASDIYQLGLVLYEMLSGFKPFTFPDRSYTAMERIILEQEPPNPSRQTLLSDTKKLEKICETRSTTPKQLKEDLKGDLDAIILKALNKEADKRFSSVAEFKEEIHRYLSGLPVKSRGKNFLYKSGKFLRRNKMPVGFGVCFLLVFVAFGIIYSHSITHERNIARKEAVKSEQVKDFMVDLMQSLDPSEVKGEPVSATLLLDRGAARVHDSEFQAPEVRGELLLTIADVYRNLGLYDQTEELLDELFDHIGTHHDEMELLAIQAKLLQAMLQSELGEYDSALTLYKEIKNELESNVPGEKKLMASFYSDYALNFRSMGHVETADSLFQIALMQHEELYEPHQPEMAHLFSRYATVLSDQGNLEEAKKYQEEVLKAYRKNYGEVHPEVLKETNNLATSYTLLGEYAEADSMFGAAYHVAQQLFDGRHTITGIILQNHANVKARIGSYEESLQMNRQVLELREEEGTYRHPTTGFTTLGICNVLLRLERYDEALTWAEETFELFEQGLPSHHWGYDLASSLSAEAQFRLGRFNPEMVETARQSFENLEDARGIRDEYTQRALLLLTELYTHQGNDAKAEEYRERIIVKEL